MRSRGARPRRSAARAAADAPGSATPRMTKPQDRRRPAAPPQATRSRDAQQDREREGTIGASIDQVGRYRGSRPRREPGRDGPPGTLASPRRLACHDETRRCGRARCSSLGLLGASPAPAPTTRIPDADASREGRCYLAFRSRRRRSIPQVAYTTTDHVVTGAGATTRCSSTTTSSGPYRLIPGLRAEIPEPEPRPTGTSSTASVCATDLLLPRRSVLRARHAGRTTRAVVGRRRRVRAHAASPIRR